MTETGIQLPGAGSVAETYRHYPKLIAPGEDLALPGGYFKWYDIYVPDAGMPAEVRAEAREFLVANGQSFEDELGFVILHRCGESFYFLLVQTWRNQQELWETVYAKDGGAFELFPAPGPARGTFCVWELGAVWHEQQAWTRYLNSNRDNEARLAYVADHFTGLASQPTGFALM